MSDWYDGTTATLGDRIAAAREAAGLSQQDLAARLGVRKRSLLEWENDRAEPRANRLSTMSGILGVSIVWLMTGQGEGLTTPVEGAPPNAAHIRAELAQLREICDRMGARIRALEQELS